jgi:uncharacterized membrane protein YqhA
MFINYDILIGSIIIIIIIGIYLFVSNLICKEDEEF